MSDLISRKDAIEATWKAFLKVCEIKDKAGWQNTEPTFAVLEAMSDISRLPSADRPTGEWIFNPKDAIELMFTKPKCSECGFESADGGNFCPNCGAKMKGADDED